MRSPGEPQRARGGNHRGSLGGCEAGAGEDSEGGEEANGGTGEGGKEEVRGGIKGGKEEDEGEVMAGDSVAAAGEGAIHRQAGVGGSTGV